MTCTHRTLILAVTAALALAAASCTQRADVGTYEVSSGPAALDVLFVIDNSGSMAEEQSSLAANFQLLIDQLETAPGGLPSVHIGVVSTNLGAGPYNLQGCPQGGDNGAFQSASMDGICAPPTGPFIRDVPAADSSRDRNYTGTLADTFACIAQLGIDGCGYEQPLESMRRALDSADGAAFVRNDAYLAVVILTDEDDCSAHDTAVFDPSDTQVSALGPLTSFRCSEFGLTCDGGPIARTPATYTNCQPQASSPYLYHPDEFASFLTALKGGDDDKVIVSVISGDRDGLEVATDSYGPTVQPSCSSAAGVAYGGHRLGYFADQFPNSLFTTICDPDLAGALESTARLITGTLDPDADPGDPDGDDDTGGCSTGGGAPGVLIGLAVIALIARRRRDAAPHPTSPRKRGEGCR